MKAYKNWAPTAFDQRGAFLPDRGEWLVLGLSRTRDSGPLDNSNFEQALAMLADGREDAEDFETHSFNHWGPGWVEIILVAQGSRASDIGAEIESALANYPVLNEQDYCAREWDEFCGAWDSWACRDFVRELVKVFGLSDRAEEMLESADRETLREFWMDNANEPYFSESDGVNVPTRRTGDHFERADVARLLAGLRRTQSAQA